MHRGSRVGDRGDDGRGGTRKGVAASACKQVGRLRNISFEGCVAQRLKVVHVEMGRLSVEMGGSGYICVGIGPYEGVPPLLVVYDEGRGGGSMPVLMCLQELLPLLASAWRGLFPVMGANVVIRSGDGKWDVAFIKWSQQALIRRVDAAPLRWAGEKARSEGAFVRAFGIQAARTMHMLFRMRVSNSGSLST